MSELPLTPTGVALVDESDFHWLNQWKWQVTSDGKYAMRIASSHGRRYPVLMHRAILCAPSTYEVDHVNGDGLDNRRQNMRLATRSENAQNMRGARADSVTGIRGVQPTPSGRFTARLWVNGQQIHLGTFAARADAEAAVIHARAEAQPFSGDAREAAS